MSVLAFIENFIAAKRSQISFTLLVIAWTILGGVLFPEIIARYPEFAQIPLQKEAGKVAFIMLMIILFLSPLSKITRWRILTLVMPFRKELGIIMGMLVLVHYILFLRANWEYIDQLSQTFQLWLAAGFWAFILTMILTITSNVRSMKLLGKWWKKLHMVVYGVVALTLLHVVALGLMKEQIEWGYISVVGIYIILKIIQLS